MAVEIETYNFDTNFRRNWFEKIPKLRYRLPLLRIRIFEVKYLKRVPYICCQKIKIEK